jgi:Mn2+/Fe2+ NRAMP family transporter
MRNGSNDGVGIDRPNDRPERAAADSRSLIGPAFVTAALVFGPGSITTASSIGASLGYSLLWVTVLAVVFMLVYADMGIRIGMAMQASPIEVMKEKWGRMVGVLVGTGGFLVTISFQAGNSAGASVAMNLLFGGNIALWAAFFTALAIVLLWLPDYYKSLERIMVGLIVIMLVAFLVTAIFAKPRVGALAQGFVPGIPAGGGLLIIALIGTTFSVVGAFYQAYLAQEKGWRRTGVRTKRQRYPCRHHYTRCDDHLGDDRRCRRVVASRDNRHLSDRYGKDARADHRGMGIDRLCGRHLRGVLFLPARKRDRRGCSAL